MAEERPVEPASGSLSGDLGPGGRSSESVTLEPPVGDRPSVLGAAPTGGGRKTWLPSRGLLVAFGLVLAFEIAIGFVPLFGGPGYESSLATGIFVPSVVAVATAFGLTRGERREPFDAFCRAVANGALTILVALVVSLVHGARVGLCDVVAGLENFALGPAPGALLAGV